MSHRKGNTVVICPEPPGVCALCGKIEELRPYGPKGERICFACGMKNKAVTEKMMNAVLFGATGEPSHDH